MVKRKNLLDYYMLAIVAIGIITFATLPSIIGSINYREIDRNVHGYYDALMSQDYEKAYSYVLLYDRGVDMGPEYIYEEGKAIYISRMNKLTQEKGYKVLNASINPEKDSHGQLRYRVELEILIDGEKRKYNEWVKIANMKLYIGSEDIYAPLRDGRMEVRKSYHIEKNGTTGKFVYA
ncbi:hypothetical protein OXPF_27270 [Oxobacter pfennigii]|uniref:Uncharacterized protein n=1 Tax=Oxobacter pfennigii TaxID=36849 RepID=A0A0P8WY37_9CLOT|nr:hypothetical protein [Oxobacter pfennigii]KPU43286.1 hypothetical protein OXPF_27270 [Oxobacter pfennigii]